MSVKRSYETYSAPVYVPPPRPIVKNAFNKLMNASNIRVNETNANQADFGHWLEFFEKQLEKAEIATVHPYQWSRAFTQAVVSTAESIIACHGKSRLINVKTKVSALHALAEMALAVAHAPGAEEVRNGATPGILVDSMLQILESIDAVDLSKVAREEGFLFKVKGLRRRPQAGCDENIWSGLDDVFRLLKEPGPIAFQRCCKKIKDALKVDRSSRHTSDQIAKIIRNDISAAVSPDSCYETKYNALDSLVEIGYCITDTPLGKTYAVLTASALEEGLQNVARRMTKKETKRAVEELRNTPGLSPFSLNDYIANAQFKGSNSRPEHSEKIGKLRVFALKMRSEPRLEQAKHGLLAKVLDLRRVSEARREREWTSTSIPDVDRLYFALDSVVEVFMDCSIPLRCAYLADVAGTVFEGFKTWYSSLHLIIAGTRHNLCHIINQLSKRATGRRACFETKLNAFKALVQIGVHIVVFRLDNPAGSHQGSKLALFDADYYGGIVIETVLTGALLSICQSFDSEEWTKITSDDAFCSAIYKLNDTRRSAPGALPGLQAIITHIRKPSHGSLGKVMTSVGAVDVIDLSAD